MTEEVTMDLQQLDSILAAYEGQHGAIIPVLQQAQAILGYLPREALEVISRRMRVPLSQIYGVATFYSQFALARRGKHRICQCDGTACHVRGSDKIVAAMEKQLGIRAGETTPDYKYTYEVVYCLGSCALAPVAVIDDQVVGHLTPEQMSRLVQNLEGTSQEDQES